MLIVNTLIYITLLPLLTDHNLWNRVKAYLQHPQARKGPRKAARRVCRKDLLGGLGMSGLGPPQLASITNRTDDTLLLANAAAMEHLYQSRKTGET